MERERVTVQEAAKRLGVTESAVRKRLERRTLPHDKEDDGRVYVYLNTRDMERDKVQDSSYDMIVTRLENENDFLRRELERKDAILLNMTDAMKALSPPPEETPPGQEQETSPAASGPLSRLLHEAGTTAVTTLVAQAVGAAIAAFSAVQGELRITLYSIALNVLVLAGGYLYVRRQSARTPVPEGERSSIPTRTRTPTSTILVAAGLIVGLVVFSIVFYYGYTIEPTW